jgi:hypothetical protein
MSLEKYVPQNEQEFTISSSGELKKEPSKELSGSNQKTPDKGKNFSALELSEQFTYSPDLKSKEQSNAIEKNPQLSYLENVAEKMKAENLKYNDLSEQDKEYVNTALTNYAKDLSGDAQDAEIGATKEKYAEIYNKIMS